MGALHRGRGQSGGTQEAESVHHHLDEGGQGRPY